MANRRTGLCHKQHVPEEVMDKGHDIHLYGEEGSEGNIMVCHLCGHYGQMRWTGLLQPCKGNRSKQKRTLKWFAEGKHPKAPHTIVARICRAQNITAERVISHGGGRGKGRRGNLGEIAAQQEGEPEEGKEEQQMKILAELERETAREMQQRDEGEDEEREKEQGEPEEREYEDEEVFSFSE